MSGGFKSNPLQARAKQLHEEARARLYDIAPDTSLSHPVAPTEAPSVNQAPPLPSPSYKRRGRRPGASPRRDEGHTIYFEPQLWHRWTQLVNKLGEEGHREVSMSMVVRIALRKLSEEDVRAALESVQRL